MRLIRLPGFEPFDYDALNEDDRELVDEQLKAFAKIVNRNPLQGLDPFSKQKQWLASRAKVKMAIAGNRAGKTHIGVVYVLLQCVDADCLPTWLLPYKYMAAPCKARVVTMDLGSTLFGTMIPKFISLVPKDQLLGGAWDKAFEKSLRMLRFKNGSSVQFLSCDQDREKHSGADLDLVLFDEEPPPPNGYDIYRENRMRLVDRAGQMAFCMTPSLTSGGLSWSYDELYERRDDLGVDVVQWSMLDNPHLPKEEVATEIASIRSEKEMRARIYGDFVHFRGRVLEEFDHDKHVVPTPTRDHIKGLDVIVGIDPGIARGGVVWVGFDRDNHALVFDELYPEGKHVPVIAQEIRAKNRWWDIDPEVYVIDPTSRNRSMTDGFNVKEMFMREGVHGLIDGPNDRVAGIMEMKARLENPPALLVAESCNRWLFEQNRWLVAEDETTSKGDQFKTLGPDHLMDPTRYTLLFRPYGMGARTQHPVNRGYFPTFDPELERQWKPSRPQEQSPMGAYT